MFYSFDFGTKIAYYIKKKSGLGCGSITQLIIGPAWQGPNTTQNKVQQQRQINFKLEYMESVKPVCQIADGSVPVAIHSYRTHIKDEKTLRTRTGLGRILSNKTVAKCQLWMLRGAAESLFPSPPHGGARCLLISPELQGSPQSRRLLPGSPSGLGSDGFGWVQFSFSVATTSLLTEDPILHWRGWLVSMATLKGQVLVSLCTYLGRHRRHNSQAGNRCTPYCFYHQPRS